MRSLKRRDLLIAGAALATTATASAAQFDLRCASDNPVDHPSSVRGKQMWAAVERESGGRLRCEFFPNSQLGGDSAMLGQLRAGAIHFMIIGLGILQAVVPSVDITNIGFVFKDEDEALRVVDGPLGDYLRKDIAAHGLSTFPKIWGSGMRQITSSSHPIRTADDCNGFKIRVVQSRITVDLFKTLGASPTPLGFNELYTVLQTKIVDGDDLPLATIESGRIFEVQKYLSLTNHTWSGLALTANADAWKSLPADLQAIVERNAQKYAVLERRDTKLLGISTADKLARQGLIVNPVDPATFRARLRPYYANWAKEFGSTAWGLLESSVRAKLD